MIKHCCHRICPRCHLRQYPSIISKPIIVISHAVLCFVSTSLCVGWSCLSVVSFFLLTPSTTAATYCWESLQSHVSQSAHISLSVSATAALVKCFLWCFAWTSLQSYSSILSLLLLTFLAYAHVWSCDRTFQWNYYLVFFSYTYHRLLSHSVFS